jgi:hypothetical protein
MDRIKAIKARIQFIKTELVMINYSSGWAKDDFEKELATLELELKELQK